MACSSCGGGSSFRKPASQLVQRLNASAGSTAGQAYIPQQRTPSGGAGYAVATNPNKQPANAPAVKRTVI